MSDIETYEQKKRRLSGKINYLPVYLQELSRLLLCDVDSSKLLSIVETDKFLGSISYFQNQEADYIRVIKFSEKDLLKEILHENVSDWNVPYMLCLSDSLVCGLMPIPSLHCFNWDFKFNDEAAGIISFTRVDGIEDIVLDYEEEFGEQILEIRIKRH